MEKAILIALLGLANEANEEQIKIKITSLVNSQNEAATARTALSNEQTARAGLENQFKAERKARCELLVDSAIREGRVPVANRAQWIVDMEKDFEGKSVALANEKKSVANTESRTRGQGARRIGLTNQSEARQKVDGLVNDKIAQGFTFDAAWTAVKREHAGLFNEMQVPEPLER